jgi:hypothetical protein
MPGGQLRVQPGPGSHVDRAVAAVAGGQLRGRCAPGGGLLAPRRFPVSTVDAWRAFGAAGRLFLSGSELRPGCKHPLGAVRAAWGQGRHHQSGPDHGLVEPPPQANIGLATGCRFDVLDVDSPAGERAIRQLAAAHGLASSGPLVRTGGGGWHFYLALTGLGNVQPYGLAHVDWRGWSGYVVAPPSRHASGHLYRWVTGRDLETPPGPVPGVLLERLQPRQLQRPTAPIQRPAATEGPGDRYARAALTGELARVATARGGNATGSCGSRPATSTTWSPPAPSTTARSTKASWRPPNAAGCSPTSRARPAAPWPRAARSASSTPATHPPPNAPRSRRSSPRRRPRGRQGEGVMAMAAAGHEAG